MEKYIGKELMIRIDGIAISGKLIADRKDRIVLIDEKGIEVSVIKSKIAFFCCKEKIVESDDVKNDNITKSGIHLYGYFDAKGKEVGKYYISGDEKNPVDIFSKSCKINPHWIKDMGDLFEIPIEKLKEIIGGMILGDD